MPNINPLKNGDVPYPNHSNVISKYIKNALALTKGLIYTSDSNGRLILPLSTNSVADLSSGIFQAMDTYPAPTAEDTDTGQVLTKPSWIIMKDPTGGLVVGSEVELESSSSTTTADQVMVAVQPHTKGYLGAVHEIYTKNTNGTRKEVTVVNDLVVVKLGET